MITAINYTLVFWALIFPQAQLVVLAAALLSCATLPWAKPVLPYPIVTYGLGAAYAVLAIRYDDGMWMVMAAVYLLGLAIFTTNREGTDNV